MSDPLARPKTSDNPIKRVAILFSGGPAPAANSVINCRCDCLHPWRNRSHRYQTRIFVPSGIRRKYAAGRRQRLCHSGGRLSGACSYDSGDHYRDSPSQPGKVISDPEHLNDPERTGSHEANLQCFAFVDVDAFISIGGDDTLKTANKFKLFQDTLSDDAKNACRPSPEDNR